MTLRQEAVQLISNMPDENIRVIIDLLHMMNPVTAKNSRNDKSMEALKWMQEMHDRMPANAYSDLDIELERQEALAEKYGNID